MKTLMLVLAFILTMNVSMASTNAGIKDAIDEFMYVMDVEGAALSPELSQKASAELGKKLEGADRGEVLNIALSRIADKKLAGEVKAALLQINADALSPEEANALLSDVLRNNQPSGASWFPVKEAAKIVLLTTGMLVLLLGTLFIVTKLSPCPENYDEETCADWEANGRWHI